MITLLARFFYKFARLSAPMRFLTPKGNHCARNKNNSLSQGTAALLKTVTFTHRAPAHDNTNYTSNAVPIIYTGNPLPAVVHQILPPTATHSRRVLVVGDVHGCAEELQRLLDKCYFRKGTDLLIQVGDLVNKGPLSLDVLRVLKEYDGLAVRGNHDEAGRCLRSVCRFELFQNYY